MSDSEKSSRKTLVNIALVVVYIAIAVSAYLLFPPKLKRLAQLERQRDELKQNMDLVKGEIEIQRHIAFRLENDAEFFEETIRRYFGYVRKNELP